MHPLDGILLVYPARVQVIYLCTWLSLPASVQIEEKKEQRLESHQYSSHLCVHVEPTLPQQVF